MEPVKLLQRQTPRETGVSVLNRNRLVHHPTRTTREAAQHLVADDFIDECAHIGPLLAQNVTLGGKYLEPQASFAKDRRRSHLQTQPLGIGAASTSRREKQAVKLATASWIL
jgi:hypothetical protein